MEDTKAYDAQIYRWKQYQDGLNEAIKLSFYVGEADTYEVLGHPLKWTDNRGNANKVGGIRYNG